MRSKRKNSIVKAVHIPQLDSYKGNTYQDSTPRNSVSKVLFECTSDSTFLNSEKSNIQTPSNLKQRVESKSSRKRKYHDQLEKSPQKTKRKDCSDPKKRNAGINKDPNNREIIIAKRLSERKKFLEGIKTSNVFTCFSCKRLLMRKSVTYFKTNKFHPCQDLLQLFSDAKKMKEKLFICHTCCQSLKKKQNSVPILC